MIDFAINVEPLYPGLDLCEKIRRVSQAGFRAVEFWGWDGRDVDRIRETCEGVAAMCGGTAKVTVTKLLPYVLNNEVMVEKLKETADKVIGKENVMIPQRTLGGEDFAFMTRVKPCVLFRLGSTNAENPDTLAPLHNGHFDIDENCFKTGMDMFVNFVLDHQDGISF